MATFIATVKFTQQGLEAVRETGKHAAAFKVAAKKLGVKVRDIYWTLGYFDGVIICEAPDDASVAAAMMQLSRLGNVHTTTARAFDAGEIEKVVGKLGK